MRQAKDLEIAASLGVDMCGFIFHPASPRFIGPQEVSALPTFGMTRVGVFVNQTLDEILDIQRTAKLDLIQLHGDQDVSFADKIGPERIIRVVWPERFDSVDSLNSHLEKNARYCKFFLLDAGKSLGGSGKRIDRKLLSNLIIPKPWFLAGGIGMENLKSSLNSIKPDGLDINSSLEQSPGKKDPDRMKAFINLLSTILNRA